MYLLQEGGTLGTMSIETTRRSKAGRTQEERSAATRAALLDATIEVLAEDGYAGLTTTKVAARAGVTRGAQVHHFPSRESLVIAAVAHLLDRTTTDLAEVLSAHPDLSIGDLLDLLWKSFRGPVFQAVLQLSAARPAESELQESLRRLDQTITRLVRDRAPALLGSAYRPEDQDALFTAFSAMSGLALNYRFVDLDEDHLAVRWARTRTQLLRLFAT